ncbi:MAG: PCRF domain-containing protein, partial [Nitrospirota bacterium]|nr:PCRF domain-containing protein [Nitrospirota bacterium]
MEKVKKDLVSDNVWASPQNIQELLKRKSKLEDIVSHFESLSNKLSYLEESISILEEESGELFLHELQKSIKGLKGDLDTLEIQYLLTGELDKNNAIITIHPGAGGTESQDWAQ